MQAPAPQLAELLRLQQAGVTRDTGFELWFYGNENVRIEAHAFVEPARTGEVHLEPELMVTPHYGKPSELVAHASGKLRCLAEPPVEGVPVTPATLHWTRRDNEPFSVPTKVALTPVTLVMDVAFGPVALIGICYMQMYHWFGGRG